MNSQIYDVAREKSAWRDLSHFGQFRVSGKDAATLLHHLTTNDIKGLKKGAACDAVLISHKGRVLDWLTILREENSFLVITSPNRRAIFQPHMTKFIMFRQDVKIEDVTGKMHGVFGTQAEDTLPSCPEGTRLPEGGKNSSPFGGGWVGATNRLPNGGFFVLNDEFPASIPCDDETYNILRVEAGVPVTGLELTENINPWEASLDDSISLHKGCYNGQEIIARLNTYQKVKQGLFGLRLEHEIPLPQLTNAPAKLRFEGRDAGFVTSSAQSPRFGPIALAFVRGDYQTSGQKLEVQTPDGTQNATVCALPFAE